MTAPEPYPAWVLEMVTDHYDRIAEGVEDRPHESIADMILEGYERGKSDADLTTAYMVGFEKGKDAARDDTTELVEALAEPLRYFLEWREEIESDLGIWASKSQTRKAFDQAEAALARVKGGAK